MQLQNPGVSMKKFITILLITISLKGYAQPELEDGDGTVPVDGGVSVLLAIGTAYGLRKVRISSRRK